jgi:O-antigen/teichoic acid export membrane protein
MKITISKIDILLSYSSQILKIASGVLVLPMILIWVPSNELGIWYIFSAISAFVLLLDFGFSPTIMRSVSYIFSGVTELKSNGFSSGTLGKVDYGLLKSIIRGVKRIYLIISSIALVILLIAGTIYINSIIGDIPDHRKYMIIWVFYVLVTVINLFFLFYNPLLQGRGLVGKSYIITIITNFTYILIVGIGVYLKYGLIALIVGNSATIILTIILSVLFFYDKNLKTELRNALPKYSTLKEIMAILWPNTYKVGLVAIGSFCISKSALFFVTSFTDLNTLASYGLSLSGLTFIAGFSQIFFNAYMPEFNQMRIMNDTGNLMRKFGIAHSISLLTFISGILVLNIFGNRILSLINVSTYLLENKYLWPISLIYLLEVNFTNFTAILVTKNEIPYMKQYLVSGFFIVLISLVLIKYTSLGLWSIIISQGSVQLVYNYWKWPTLVCQEFNTSFFNLLRTGLADICQRSRLSLSKIQPKRITGQMK